MPLSACLPACLPACLRFHAAVSVQAVAPVCTPNTSACPACPARAACSCWRITMCRPYCLATCTPPLASGCTVCTPRPLGATWLRLRLRLGRTTGASGGGQATEASWQVEADRACQVHTCFSWGQALLARAQRGAENLAFRCHNLVCCFISLSGRLVAVDGGALSFAELHFHTRNAPLMLGRSDAAAMQDPGNCLILPACSALLAWLPCLPVCTDCTARLPAGWCVHRWWSYYPALLLRWA